MGRTKSFHNRAWVIVLGFAVAVLAPSASRGQADQNSGANVKSSAPRKSPPSSAKQSAAEKGSALGQKTFSSPEQAAAALYSAAHDHDENQMVLILGPGSKDLIVWTDDPEIRNSEMDVFVQKYDRMHRLVHEPDDETTLYVGAENWPLPIPIVKKSGKWYFDSVMGKQEVLFRRIGENELDAVESLHALVDAENDFYSQTTDSDGAREYASRFASTNGQHDGLYWPSKDGAGAEECPIGQYLAQADYDAPDRKPLHGYYFRMLTEQGPKATGGALSYTENGKLVHGFAFVAFPAKYRSSGVQTFVVNEHGRVYEKDLGQLTQQAAKSMKTYNPDSTWTRMWKPAEQN